MKYGALEQSESSLPGDDDIEINIGERRGRTLNGRTSAVIALVIFILASACVSNYKPVSSGAFLTGVKVTSLDAYSQIGVTASNEYGIFNAPYPWLASVGSQIVEPYKVTTLSVTGMDSADSTVHYKWTLPSNLTKVNANSRGNQCNITATEVGKYYIKVEAFDLSDSLVASFSATLICKFVKREIRSLTIPDRERFLDAASALWKYNQTEGQAKFGPKFTSIEIFVAYHSEASNDNMCDQFHDGTGFLTHHLALTNSFEAAMRTVDPSVTLPYWDFTIEGQSITNQHLSPSHLTSISPVFSNEWFGAVDENNHIMNSRWAHTAMPRQTGDGVRNSYGLIRSYWNNNPDKEITRHLFEVCGLQVEQKKIPNCGKHFEILASKDLGEFLLKSPGDGHGPMHVGIGGMWGGCTTHYAALAEKWETLLDADMTDDEVTALNLGKEWTWGLKAPRRKMVEAVIIGEYFHIYRSLWRSHMCAVDGTPRLLVCPDRCAEGVPFAECGCQVDKLVNNETTWQNLLPCVLGSPSDRFDFQAIMPEAFISDVVTMVATAPVLEGDMLESSSPSDILFWLIHPCIERLLSAKRLETITDINGFEITKWNKEDKGNMSTWVQKSVYDFPMGANAFYSNQTYECAGHGVNSTIMSADRLTDTIERQADLDKNGLITNWEFYLTLDPNNEDANDYVFDNFEWDHCTGLQLEEESTLGGR